MNNIMLDLETLGTNSHAPIVSIGAVWFDENRIGTLPFYRVLDVNAQVKYYDRKMDVSTIEWWMVQSDEARAVFKHERADAVNALADFSEWVGTTSPCMWGNGADFDCVILGNLYEAMNLKKPWSYSKNRCYRTLKNLGIMTREPFPGFEGVAHNALDDAIYQAKCAQIHFKGALPSARSTS